MSELDPSKLSSRLDEVLNENGFVCGWFYHFINSRLTGLCESPIEALLGAAILFLDKFHGYPGFELSLAKQGEIHEWPASARLLIPQYKFGAYRIDWVYRDGQNLTFIECDGHDFHERTKEQASRDKRRDREIQAAGYPVLRFTGSDIWADPFDCASQIQDFVNERNVPAELREAAR